VAGSHRHDVESRVSLVSRAVIGDNGALVHEERMLTEIGTRMRDVVQAPDGRVFVLAEASAFASPGAILVLEPGAEPAAAQPRYGQSRAALASEIRDERITMPATAGRGSCRRFPVFHRTPSPEILP
jgi:hypothetical protein